MAAGIYPKAMVDGDVDASAWSRGMVAGLINDIPSVQQLIDRLVTGAHLILGERLQTSLD